MPAIAACFGGNGCDLSPGTWDGRQRATGAAELPAALCRRCTSCSSLAALSSHGYDSAHSSLEPQLCLCWTSPITFLVVFLFVLLVVDDSDDDDEIVLIFAVVIVLHIVQNDSSERSLISFCCFSDWIKLIITPHTRSKKQG